MRILERRAFDFSSLPAGASISRAPLMQRAPLATATSVVAALRLHTATFPSGATARIEVIAIAPTDEDPAQDFVGPIVASIELLSTVTAPGLFLSPLGERFGGFVSVYLSVTQSLSGGTFKFTISLDLDPKYCGNSWSPLDLGSKLKCWLDQRDQVLVSGKVITWGDQSPSGLGDFDMSVSSGRRPDGSTQVNQLAAPRFDGVNDYMTCQEDSSYFWSASGGHLLAVVDTTGETLTADDANIRYECVILSTTGSGWFGLGWSTSGPRGYAKDAGGYQATPRATTTTGIRLFDFWLDNGTLSLRIDGGVPVSVGGIGTLVTDATEMNLGQAQGLGRYFAGKVAALIICDAPLSAVEQQAARRYLSSKYGVPA